MPRHPHIGEGSYVSASFIARALSGNPPRSLAVRLLGGVLVPVGLLAYGVRCLVTRRADVVGSLPPVGPHGAIAVGIALADDRSGVSGSHA